MCTTKIRIREATEKGYAEVGIGGVFDASYPTSKTRRGRVQEGGGGLPDTDGRKAGDLLLRGLL
jgi:DNA (cytosine-5)-methyltransferase 1